VEHWRENVRILCIANQKGGVGKTTTAVHLAAGAALGGLRVLLCDLDAQGNATSGLGLEAPSSAPPPPVPPGREGLDVLSLGRWLSERPNLSLSTLADMFPQDRYDLAVLDCPPAFGRATELALEASDWVLIPIQCEYFAMEGLSQILASIRACGSRRGRTLPVLGILLTLYDPQEEVSAEVASEVKKVFPDQTFSTIVNRDGAFVEASSFGKTIYEYDIFSPGAWEYLSLTKEVLSNVRGEVGTQAV